MFKLKAGVALLVTSLYANSAWAVDDAQARLVEMEGRIKALTETMGQQIKDLSSQVQTLQSQLQNTQARQDMANKKNEDLVKASIREVGSFKDGLILEDGGDWRLQMNGGIQTDFRHFSPDEQNADTFSIRRAQLITTLFLFKDFAFQLGGEYANTTGASTVAMTNGYFEYQRWPEAKFRMGQFRPLFSLEHVTNDNYLGYLERSLAYNLSSDLTMDRGVMLHGAPIKGTYYSIALTNGTGQNLENQTTAKDYDSDGFDTTVRVRANFAELYNINDTVLHFGGSYNQGTLTKNGADKAAFNVGRTEGRGLTFFTANDFDGSNIDRSRWALEGAIARGPVKLMAEYVNLNYEGRSAAGNSFDRDIGAWYASAQWTVTGESYADGYAGGVFNRIRPKQNFDRKDGWGAFELGVRYSRFDASDFTFCGADAGVGCLKEGSTNEAEAWTLAANWIFNPYVRVMANYVRTDFDDDVTLNTKSSDHEDALTMRAQFNF